MLKKLKLFAWLMGALTIVQGLGCAASYHRYSDCCGVNCRYCEPSPLPYSHYPGCACHSKSGARYLSTAPSHQSSVNRSKQDTRHSEVSDENIEATEPEQINSAVELQPVFDISQRAYDD